MKGTRDLKLGRREKGPRKVLVSRRGSEWRLRTWGVQTGRAKSWGGGDFGRCGTWVGGGPGKVGNGEMGDGKDEGDGEGGDLGRWGRFRKRRNIVRTLRISNRISEVLASTSDHCLTAHHWPAGPCSCCFHFRKHGKQRFWNIYYCILTGQRGGRIEAISVVSPLELDVML